MFSNLLKIAFNYCKISNFSIYIDLFLILTEERSFVSSTHTFNISNNTLLHLLINIQMVNFFGKSKDFYLS